MDLVLTTDLTSLFLQILVTLLYGLAFVFLWRQSGILYFGLWSIAWCVEAAGLGLEYGYAAEHSFWWLAGYALMEFAFAVLLFAAGRAGFSGPVRDWRNPLKILLGFPVFLILVYIFEWHTRPQTAQALHSVVLCSVYAYNYTGIRGQGIGARVFRMTLLALALLFLYYAAILMARALQAPWALPSSRLYDFGLHAVLTVAALAMWIETQQQRVCELHAELERVRRESSRNLDLDHLTGLLNQAALERRLGETGDLHGVVAVCDMDNFKEINDRYGHLTGDEILRNIGRLFQSSIRTEDEAFRWGGDEFVFLFYNQEGELVKQRMRELQERLKQFRLRGLGALPIAFSFGAAEMGGRALREALDEADHAMYRQKNARRT
jgi:diguanylate cyclase (GGDEF)-like protein